MIYGCLGCCGFLKGSEKMDEIVDEFSESDSEREDSYNDSILTMATEERRKKRLIESEE